jgi:hypothetical protein
MKFKTVLTAAFALLCALPSAAQQTANCVKGTLASYIALGSQGCMFGSVLYRSFTYATPVLDPITPAQIVVTPVVLPTSTFQYQGLNFSAPWSVAAGGSEVATIGYSAVPYPPQAGPETLGGVLTLDLGPSQVSGIIGSVSVQEKTNIATLDVYETCADACSIKQRDSVTITPIQVLQTSITISLSGGNGGASLSSFATDYAVGPQPE